MYTTTRACTQCPYVSVIIEPFWSVCVINMPKRLFFGGGGGMNCFSREVRSSFSSRKQMATYDFHGEVRTPCPLCLRPYIRVSNSLNSHFIYFFCWAWPGQFTKRLLIISADAKGKDSMILFKITETAHINSGHVLF